MEIHSENSFEVKESEITNAGNGLFAKVDIMSGETLGYYSGEVITEDDLDAVWDKFYNSPTGSRPRPDMISAKSGCLDVYCDPI